MYGRGMPGPRSPPARRRPLGTSCVGHSPSRLRDVVGRATACPRDGARGPGRTTSTGASAGARPDLSASGTSTNARRTCEGAGSVSSGSDRDSAFGRGGYRHRACAGRSGNPRTRPCSVSMRWHSAAGQVGCQTGLEALPPGSGKEGWSNVGPGAPCRRSARPPREGGARQRVSASSVPPQVRPSGRPGSTPARETRGCAPSSLRRAAHHGDRAAVMGRARGAPAWPRQPRDEARVDSDPERRRRSPWRERSRRRNSPPSTMPRTVLPPRGCS